MDALDYKTIYTREVPVYQHDKKVKYITDNLSFLVLNEKRVSNYYSQIKYLKFNDYYKVAYRVNRIVTRYKVIKLQRDENNKIIPFHEQIVINDLYRYIYFAGKNTLTVENDGLYSYIELNEKSPYYLKTLYPFAFTMVSSFGLEYPSFAKVNIGLNKGYIYRVESPITELNFKDLFTKEEVGYLNGVFNQAHTTAIEKLSHYAPKLTLHL